MSTLIRALFGQEPARPAHRRIGFTLVELLVVVSIISLLLSLLLPALNRAREVAKRTACMSQLHNVGFAQFGHASDHRGEIARHARWDVQTIFSRSFGAFWVNNYGTEDKWTGTGLLWYRECIGNPKMIWCPANSSPNLAFDHPEWGWREDPYTQGKKWMAQPMQQNTSIADYDDVEFPAGTGIFSDGFVDSEFYNPGLVDSVLYHHQDGYSVAYVDGSTAYYQDADFEIADLDVGSGSWALQDTVWLDYFGR